jgi:hypothetical protein
VGQHETSLRTNSFWAILAGRGSSLGAKRRWLALAVVDVWDAHILSARAEHPFSPASEDSIQHT